MKEKIETLVRLQKIETEANGIRIMLNSVSDKLDTLEAKVNEFEQSIEKETSVLNELKKKYRSYESDIKTNDAQIKKSQEKLNSVKTNKEYQALLKGIQELKAKNSQIEDEMLECLERTNEMEKNIAIKKAEFSKFENQTKTEKGIIEKESNRGKKKLADLDTDWQNVSKTTDPELLKKFIAVKSRAGGIAVAPVVDSVCQACNMNIPPQMYNDLYRCESLKFCPNCQRIIYWEKPSSLEN
ncbi:zinc ribbon domain-containing protein [Desulfonema magnum]|uniref:Zinc ribbon domain-containing protein n=1 Tax=Desulfonema magnum TaxID=45655 RepID=A0A975GKX3_9BACT|nr:C4-type zinc ribbon domain-containing protein [Desulfonema magnum]QTA85064.1 Zinc ribbon domain-containing protein [Desulfonema magnum]